MTWGSGTELPGWCVTRYEELRAGALGHPVPAEARGGLALFLRRGMWAWARATALTPPSKPATPLPTDPRGGGERLVLARLLTEMAWAHRRRET